MHRVIKMSISHLIEQVISTKNSIELLKLLYFQNIPLKQPKYHTSKDYKSCAFLIPH